MPTFALSLWVTHSFVSSVALWTFLQEFAPADTAAVETASSCQRCASPSLLSSSLEVTDDGQLFP